MLQISLLSVANYILHFFMLDPRMVWKCRIITHAWSRLTVVVRFVERSWNNKLKVLRIQRQCRGLYLNLFNFFITAPQILLFLCINQNSCCLQDILAQSWKVYICLLVVLEVSLRYIIYYTQSVCFPFFFFCKKPVKMQQYTYFSSSNSCISHEYVLAVKCD